MTTVIGDKIRNGSGEKEPLDDTKLLMMLAKIIMFAISISSLVWTAAKISASVDNLQVAVVEMQKSQAATNVLVQSLQINQATMAEQMATLRVMIKK